MQVATARAAPSALAPSSADDVAVQFVKVLNDRNVAATHALIEPGAPIAVSPLSASEAVDKGVTIDEQIGWLAAWGWHWDDATCRSFEHPAAPVQEALVEDGVKTGVVVRYDTTVTCDVTSYTKLGDVDGASSEDQFMVRLLDSKISYAHWGGRFPMWVPAFRSFKQWAETEQADLWVQAWNDEGPLITDDATKVEAQLLDEYIEAHSDGAGGDAATVELKRGQPVAVDPAVVEHGMYPVVVPWDDGFLVIAGDDENDDFTAPTTYRAVYTTDGTVGGEFDFELPVAFANFTSAGGRLVATAFDFGPNDDDHTLRISTSTDLVEWQTVDPDYSLPDDDPRREFVDAIQVDPDEAMVVVGDRWYVLAGATPAPRWNGLLPEEVQAALDHWPESSMNSSDDGLTISVFADPDSPPVDEWSFTWAELGLDGDPDGAFEDMDDGVLLAGDFGGNHEILLLPEQSGDQPGGQARLVRYGDGIMYTDWNVSVSDDGRAWTDIGQLRTNTFETEVIAVVPTGDSVLVWDVNDFDGMTRIGADGVFVPVDLPEQLRSRDDMYSDSPAMITGPSIGNEWWERDLWLIATEDGIDWFTLDVPDVTEDLAEQWDDDEVEHTPLVAHINGDLVLYGTVDGWRLVRIP